MSRRAMTKLEWRLRDLQFWSRFAFTIPFTPLAFGIVLYLSGRDGRAWGLTAATFIIIACVLQVITNIIERKVNGRHREAAEAHRAGAAARQRAGYSAHGGTGRGASALMNPYTDPTKRALWDSLNNPRLNGGYSSMQALRPAKQPTAGDFEGKQFALGVATGTRSFDVDKLGRLRGVAYSAVWRPGENQAECMERHYEMAMFGVSTAPAFSLRKSDKPEHSIAECNHGFYGYYEGSNDYYEAGRIMGVIEAYGEAVIGTRGFRASKARIVALHIPDDVSAPLRKLIARNYPDVPRFDTFDAMVTMFKPDDGGQGLNPDSDPDFWTREA